jgi:phosphopantothenoylcysteine decarboxylase / phosphopantothenate---cysteine ligase
MSLKGKKIVLAVTGSIAAYKTPHLVRLLVKAGAEVQVLLTEAGARFVSPLALSTVSGKPVLQSVAEGDSWNNHVALGLWADAMVIAPCSANTLGKLANGLCDNIVCAVYLSARCPVFVAPAMDEDMWMHPSTRANVKRIQEYRNKLIPTEFGELASGLVGEGRMAEPENIVSLLTSYFTTAENKPLEGMKAMVTAGPTYERLDPVRFIGNFSTGRMGIAIAEALADAGAQVTLVTGPIERKPANHAINIIRVESADEMYEAGMVVAKESDIAVLAAAVADYKPAQQAPNKIKKADDDLSLKLTRTKDLLAALGKIKEPRQTLVGFALETENEVENARKKLNGKNADMIVLNSLRDEGAGFGHDTNKITILKRDGSVTPLELQSKSDAAVAIVDHITQLRYAEKTV